MRLIAATLVSFALAAPALGQGDQSGPKTAKGTPMLTLDDVRSVSPALARYTQGSLLGDVWKRPGLMVWTPPTASACQSGGVRAHFRRRP